MKTKHRNIIYTASFDGDILEYKTSKLAGVVLGFLGFNHKIGSPINIVLSYKAYKRLFIFRIIELTVHRYRFGQDSPNPVQITPILFFGRCSMFLKHLCTVIDSNIEKSEKGLNMGLLDVNKDKLEPSQRLGEHKTVLINKRQMRGHFLIQQMQYGKLMRENGSFSIRKDQG